MKDLWAKREWLSPCHLGLIVRKVILLSMAHMDDDDVANAAYGYGDDIEDVRGELTDPARWSAPGWYWLSALSREDLLGLSRAIGRTGQKEGAVAYVRIASLIGSHEDVASLAELLSGPFSGLRKLAEDTVACIASLATSANLLLLRAFAKDRNPHLRKAAAKALGNVGTHDDLALLGEMASDEHPRPGVGGDFSVRDAVAEAIGKLRYGEGLHILREMVNDGDRGVLGAVAKAIGALGNAEGLPLLETLAKRGYSPAQYIAAQAYAELTTHGDLALLRESAKGGNALMRQGAAWVLKDRGGPEDVPFLREMAKSSERNVQYAAVAAIGKLGSAEDLPLLRKLATGTDGNWQIRRNAVRAIAAIGEHEDFALLLKVAANDAVKHLVGRTAARVCWQLATREDLPILVETRNKGATPEVLRGVLSAMARQFTDGEVLTAMSGVVLAFNPLVARMAAELVVPRTSADQLHEFLDQNHKNPSPQALAVFDWYLYAPPYLRDVYQRWRKEHDEMPPIGW
jgi:HEAT repeat protein